MKFSQTDACLYVAVVSRRLDALVAEGRIRRNDDGTFEKEELDRFIKGRSSDSV